ncbi:MAG: bifunctional oligoribonuclease/PAP phosphatase NrnA, partial [Planctomycetales bacterium]|nr:bifunctional oligoribonuclease/PAP phosphatase NrnA [Planctomycetales bacterium]
MTVLNEVIEEIHRNQNFIISTHVNPEGDALGSALGLALGLQSAGKKALVVNRDPVPQFLDFLPHQDIFQQRQQVTEPYDVLAVLDCGDLERTAIFDGKRLPARRVINIDHHITNRNFGHVNWVNVDATSTGEMIYELLKAMNIPISPEIADCLYTSVVTETGSFRYSNTSERTFRIASELVGCGVQPWRVAQQLFQRNRVGKLRLLALILNGMEVNRDGRMAWIRVSQADFSSTGTTAED